MYFPRTWKRLLRSAVWLIFRSYTLSLCSSMINTPASIKYPEHPTMIGLWISTLYTKRDVLFSLLTIQLVNSHLMWSNCSSPVGKVSSTLCGRTWQQGGVAVFVGKGGQHEWKGWGRYTTAWIAFFFTCWCLHTLGKRERKQTVLITLQNTSFCLQVGFFFPSAMCIVCFHFWIRDLTFVPVLKESRTNNKLTRVFGHNTLKSFPSSYPSKHSWPPSFSKEKQSDAWSQNVIWLPHWSRFSPSFAHRERLTSRGKNIEHFR